MPLKVKRFIADIIDFYIICFISSLPIYLVTLGTMEITWLTLSLYFASFVIVTIFKDFLFKDSSLGKKLLQIKVFYLNDSENKIISNVKRTLTLVLVPMEIILILKNNKRLGDLWANTEVIEKEK